MFSKNKFRMILKFTEFQNIYLEKNLKQYFFLIIYKKINSHYIIYKINISMKIVNKVEVHQLIIGCSIN